MTSEQQALLDEARRRYPHGTKYRSQGCAGKVFTVDINDVNYCVFGNHDKTWIDAGLQKGVLYNSNGWAEIVEPAPCTQYVCDGDYNSDGDCFVCWQDAREVDVSIPEIQNALPDNHPDKIKKNENWCIKCYPEISSLVIKYFKVKYQDDYSGITDYSSGSGWGTSITPEQLFEKCRKIGIEVPQSNQSPSIQLTTQGSVWNSQKLDTWYTSNVKWNFYSEPMIYPEIKIDDAPLVIKSSQHEPKLILL